MDGRGIEPDDGEHVAPLPSLHSVIHIREVSFRLCNSISIIIGHRDVITEVRWPYTTILTINFVMKQWAVEESNPLTVGAKKEQTQNEQNAIRPFAARYRQYLRLSLGATS